MVLDLGVRYRGYCSDLTRTVFLGRMSEFQKRIYRIVKRAQSRALKVVAPGFSIAALDRSARSTITRAGFGAYFGHGLGHGLGLEVHEAPVVSGRSDGRLREGMVLTIEPGIYIPGRGGVRIEDDVKVTRGGCKVLTAAPKEPIILL